MVSLLPPWDRLYLPSQPPFKQGAETAVFMRQLRSITVYLGLLLGGQALIMLGVSPFWQSVGMGLMMPAGGFLNAMMLDYNQFWHSLLLFSLGLALFGTALFLWFATGNALAPPLTWAFLTVLPLLFQEDMPFFGGVLICSSSVTNLSGAVLSAPLNLHFALFFMLALLVVALLGLVFYQEFQRQRRFASDSHLSVPPSSVNGGNKPKGRKPLRQGYVASGQTQQSHFVLSHRVVRDDELSEADLRRIRLILDRALQPIDQFEGFEWRDQFQTASVRFQVNALSYALSMVQSTKLPAFQGYMTLAQHNLAAKMLDHRVWGYWKLENMWGHLKTNPDPIALDTNIMLTGFYGLQLTMFQSAAQIEDYNTEGCLQFVHPNGQKFRYDLPHFLKVLQTGYNRANFGLMPCEPNWIYPLCNIMSVSAMSLHDRQFNTRYWENIKQSFAAHLERDFLTPDGSFITLLSAYTGLSFSKVGGAMMQAFPLIFLNQVMPEMAQRQWQKIRADLLARKDMRKAFWAFDVGNYGFSRGAGFACGAAAAVEMGDAEIAAQLLEFLEQDHPETIIEGVAHRKNMSLWAHCYEVIARCGQAGQFAQMGSPVEATNTEEKPFLKDVHYHEILVAKAIENKGLLEAVFYPAKQDGHYEVTVGGLLEGRSYKVISVVAGKVFTQRVMANDKAETKVTILVAGRTQFFLKRNV